MYIYNNEKNQQVYFGRLLKPNEVKPYTDAISKGLKVLDKQVDIILHNSSAPSKKGQNTGVGSLLSETYEKQVLPFLGKHSISAIQEEPDGLRSGLDGSPYQGDTFAKNILMIPLEKLKKSEYGSILSKDTYNDIISGRPNKHSNLVNYGYVIPKYNDALHEAYTNFKRKSASLNSLPSDDAKSIKQMSKDFIEFKNRNSNKLEKTAIYNILTKEYGDYWKNWHSAIDKTLYCPVKRDKFTANQRLSKLRNKHSDDIDEFMFNQMLISKAKSETASRNAKYGVKTIGDSAVAFSDVDIWVHQNLFLKEEHLGCPPDYFSKEGQAWGFSVLDPKTIFNKDSSLGEGGKLMFDKYYSIFKDNKGGVRIDHIIGLIDPFVYKEKPTSKLAGRLYSSPDNPDLKNYKKYTTKEYANIISNIVIPAAKKAGLDSNAILCENLGAETLQTVKDVMKYLKLKGMAVTQLSDGKADCISRGKNVGSHNVIMAGSHDFSSLIEYTNKLFANHKNNTLLSDVSQSLAEDTMPKGTDIQKTKQEIMTNKNRFIKAKFVELFTSPAKTVQIFFTDFFGIPKTYNKPGTSEGNWILRLPSPFESLYHRNLEKNRAINLPETIASAIRYKGKDFSDKNNELLQQLDDFSSKLKQKD